MADAVSLFAKANGDARLSVTDAVMTCTHSLKDLYTPTCCRQTHVFRRERKLQKDMCIVQHHVTFSSPVLLLPAWLVSVAVTHSHETLCGELQVKILIVF